MIDFDMMILGSKNLIIRLLWKKEQIIAPRHMEGL